ncbi:MAG: MBL fold metallo-hydrolase [Coriobacteriia bacterium]|nr:MBL fold metallo-hydrolase [Coriobacteriia bacterium]
MDLPAQPQRIELPDAPHGGFRLHVLASGSKGNAAIVEAGGQLVLVDCGITKKAFMERCSACGIDPTRISGIIVTHEHSDHTKGLGVVLRGLAKLGARPTVHCTPGTLGGSRELMGLQGAFDIRTVRDTAELQLGGIHAQLFPTSHDAAQPVGMAFEVAAPDAPGGFDTLGYLTDSGVLPDAAVELFARARILAIEANHDPKMLAEGPYPYPLKQRIASDAGHLSNVQSADALDRISPASLQAICGMHLSETNNLHRLARQALSGAPDGVAVAAAWQDMPLTIG